MDATLAEHLRDWHDFYLLIGTAAATLIGLMFVAASIGARYFTPEREAGLNAFLTPTVMHFTALLVACLLVLAPRHSPASLGALLVAGGAVGLAYTGRVWLGMRKLGIFGTIDLADRTWYLFAPLLAYLLMVAAGGAALRLAEVALPLLAVTLVLLLLLGIRNAWDMTVWVTIRSE